MSAAAAFVRTWRVGRYTVAFSCPVCLAGEPVTAVLEWAPDVPKRLTQAELEQYRSGRNIAIAEMAEAFGLTAAVLEV